MILSNTVIKQKLGVWQSENTVEEGGGGEEEEKNSMCLNGSFQVTLVFRGPTT